MRRRFYVLGLIGLGWAWPVTAEPAEHRLSLDLSALLELKDAWTLTKESLEQRYQSPGFSENPYISWKAAGAVAQFTTQPFTNVSVKLSLLDGQVPLQEAKVFFSANPGKVERLSFVSSDTSARTLATLKGKLDQALGCSSVSGPKPAIGWKADERAQTSVWRSSEGVAVLQQRPGLAWAMIGAPGVDRAALQDRFMTVPDASERKPEFFLRVDELLAVPGLWNLTQDEFDKLFRLPGSNLSANPFYQWSTTSRDSARIAQKLFSNTHTDLLVCNDQVQAEEVNVEFKQGKAARMTLTLLSRGNSGSVSARQFDDTFKAVGRALGAQLGVRPSRTTMSGKSLVKTDGWLWTTPHTLALLEFNEEAPKGTVEFLRLTFSPAAARSELLNLAGIGGNATTRRRSDLVRSVKRDKASGDTEIMGIPMRDQGQKGYCVAASCERLFRYMGQPCDMDELAKLIQADAERGASPAIMFDSLAKVDQRYDMRVKLLLLRPGYTLGRSARGSEEERARRASLFKITVENIDQGLPLLWAVALPPGETGLAPGSDRPTTARLKVPLSMRAGHMRVILGYNLTRQQVIYTDSWGAGHERKVMSLAEAEEMTTAVFSMSPSR